LIAIAAHHGRLGALVFAQKFLKLLAREAKCARELLTTNEPVPLSRGLREP
jgi:hypothetical protein